MVGGLGLPRHPETTSSALHKSITKVELRVGCPFFMVRIPSFIVAVERCSSPPHTASRRPLFVARSTSFIAR